MYFWFVDGVWVCLRLFLMSVCCCPVSFNCFGWLRRLLCYAGNLLFSCLTARYVCLKMFVFLLLVLCFVVWVALLLCCLLFCACLLGVC